MSDKKDKKEEKKKEEKKPEKEEEDFEEKKGSKEKKPKKEHKESVEAKAKVDAAIDDESSEEDEEVAVKVTRVGYVEMKTKSWKAVYCVLIGGSFYWMKNSTDPDPKGSVDLKGMKLSWDLKGEKKKTFTWAIEDSKGETLFVGSVATADELQQWMKDLEAAQTKDHVDPPAAIAEKKKKEGMMARAKKNMASKTATSALGKKMMKTIVNEETSTLINSLKHMVKKESNNPKKADEIEKHIIKIAVKSYLLIENKTLTSDDFLVADKPLREAFELMVKIYNGRNRVKREKILEAIDKVVVLLKKTEEIITNLLAPHMTPKNMLRISGTFAAIANKDFLDHVYSDPELEGDMEKLADAMEYYTQFHFHKG